MKKTVWLLAVLTLMVTLIPLQTMPALLPVDYSIGGEVRRWGSKSSYLILPMVTLLITLLLPKTRKNRNVGVRLPYSRYNDITWQKSNRFGGTAMVIAGLLGMVSALLAPSAELALGLFTVFLLLAVIATTWYSRKVYLEESAEK